MGSHNPPQQNVFRYPAFLAGIVPALTTVLDLVATPLSRELLSLPSHRLSPNVRAEERLTTISEIRDIMIGCTGYLGIVSDIHIHRITPRPSAQLAVAAVTVNQ